MTTDAGPAAPIPPEDMAALTALFDGHRTRLEAMLRRRIDSRLAAVLDVDDLIQDTFVLAAKRWPPKITPWPWLYRLALDSLIEAWRHGPGAGGGERRAVPWPEESSAQLGLGLAASLTSPSEAVARAEVRQLLDRLDPIDKEILWMRHFDGMPYDEIAPILDIEENAAMKRYSRALRRFEVIFTAACGPDSEGHT